MRWVVSQKFHDYLLGRRVVIYTYHNPLTYFLTTAKLDATSHRWLAELEIRYKPGRANVVADALSRRDSEYEVISTEVLCSLCLPDVSGGLIKSMCIKANVLDQLPLQHSDIKNTVDWQSLQERDSTLSQVSQLVHEGHSLSAAERSLESKDVQRFLRYLKR